MVRSIKYNKFIAFNFYGNGDIAESKTFVLDLMKIFPAKEYEYLTGKSPRLLLDVPNLKVHNNFPDFIDATIPYFLDDENNLYWNTWVGRNSYYVLNGSACVVEKIHEMHSDMLSSFSNGKLKLSSADPLDYLFSFDYSKYEINGITEYLKGKEEQKKIYVSNGSVSSNQADNFDMSPLIINLAKMFPDILFFVTEGFENFEENIIDANALTPDYLDSNLVELSYLSTFCDLLVGRNSGAAVFAWTKFNCLEREISNLTLSYHVDCAHFVYNSKINMKKFWSNSVDTLELTDIINEIITKDVV